MTPARSSHLSTLSSVYHCGMTPVRSSQLSTLSSVYHCGMTPARSSHLSTLSSVYHCGMTPARSSHLSTLSSVYHCGMTPVRSSQLSTLSSVYHCGMTPARSSHLSTLSSVYHCGMTPARSSHLSTLSSVYHCGMTPARSSHLSTLSSVYHCGMTPARSSHLSTLSSVYHCGMTPARSSHLSTLSSVYHCGMTPARSSHLSTLSSVYHCGSDLGWSPLFSFRAILSDSSWGPRLAVFGDMGNENAQSLSRLQKDTQMDMYDAVLHVGDFAYDMDKDDARVGDEFMRQIESVAAYVPYMTCPGNHEEAYNFSNYRNRFSMPGDTEGLWYSYNLGPAHIISLSTEVYFYRKYGEELVGKQFKWLQKDLQEATTPSQRAMRPWIITMGHRPMYCTNFDSDDCVRYNSVIRTGLPGGLYGLEDLFYKYGVDLEIWAHEHSYERLYPIYNHTVYKGSEEAPYTNPSAPVHITTGSAGCSERLDPFFPLHQNWSVVRIEDYGYTRIHIINKTHIHTQQVSDDQDGQIVDDFWLIKDKR
ncbi:acid phosphatase type 7 isoform 1-T1 [Discoglossus pictus]